MSLWQSLSSTERKFVGGIGGFVVFILFLGITSVAAWITHVWTTIVAKEWIFLAIGAFIPPVGVIHGWMVWFGIA